MKKMIMKITSMMLAFTVVFTSGTVVFATESPKEASTEAGDDVVIDDDDKPFLALGADLSKDQRKTVLGLMGIDGADLDEYNVVYVNNDEEHKYLGEYIDSSEIGTHSLSSVVITEGEAGAGLKLSVYNVNYCTVGMYKNACATAGVTDANIIVAAPFPISGTAALVGILKAYEEMTGNDIDEDVVDAAMDELVTTGELNESISGDSKEVEALIADLKSQLQDASWETDEEILDAIDKTAKKYELKLSNEDKQKILALLKKLKGLNLDWDSIKDQASNILDQFKDIDVDTSGIWDKICGFFSELFDLIKSLF